MAYYRTYTASSTSTISYTYNCSAKTWVPWNPAPQINKKNHQLTHMLKKDRELNEIRKMKQALGR